MVLLILALIANCHSLNLKSDDFKFSFMGRNRQKMTLTQFHNPNKIKSTSIFNKKDGNQGHWYYVHFLQKDTSLIKQFINMNIKQESFLIKDTFELFLNQKQIDLISNFSLIKMIYPNEKYYNDSTPIEKTDLLIIYKVSNYVFHPNDDYIIKQKLNDEILILKLVNHKNMNATQFNQKKMEIINYLTEIPEVKSVYTYKDRIPFNSLMAGFTQKNSLNFKKYRETRYYHLDRYLNDRGITGANQVITILDTPIDFNHANFRDEEVQVEFNKKMLNHRKFLYYRYDGTLDDWTKHIMDYEHGTHVGGIAAGKSICTNDDEEHESIFNGNAPDAKILYAGDFRTVPDDDLISLFYNYDSKISSNSWGIDSYNPYLRFYYNYHFQKLSNVTCIFAAGNEYNKFGNFSIFDPAGAKNILSVGSIDDFYVADDIFNITSIDNPDFLIQASSNDFEDPWINGSVGTEPGKTVFLVFENNKIQCDILKQNNKFIIYGMKSLLWINLCDLDKDMFFLYVDNETKVKEMLDLNSEITVTKNIIIDPEKGIKRASYSSTGPAPNGILKPDVVAPGEDIVSAKSNLNSAAPHGCADGKDANFIFMGGTSMACPNVAGGAALIRQYFESGNWTEHVILDGETTRALIINSCVHPFNSRIPDIMYGHGVVDLSTIIPIENDFGVQITPQKSNVQFSTLLADDQSQKSFIMENSHLVAKLNVDKSLNNKKLQITLSYLDTTLSEVSPIPIVHDLDLIVESPTKKIFFGDHLYNNDTQHTSTNEKVIINEDEVENGEYTIHLYSNEFVDTLDQTKPLKQEFAIVASGPIKNGFLIFSESKECPCDKCDPNRAGYCLCDSNQKFGQVCQIKIETLNQNKGSYTLNPLEVKRILISSNQQIDKIISKSSNPGQESTIWASDKCHIALSEYEINGETEDESSSSNQGIDVNYGNKLCIAIFNNNDKESTYNLEVSTVPYPTQKPTIQPPTDIPPTEPPTEQPNKKGGSSSSDNDNDFEVRTSSLTLGNFEIHNVYIGATTIVDFKFGYDIMHKARKLFGHVIPPPNFLHSAIWVGPSNENDATLGAVFVYGKYVPKSIDDQTYLFKDGARSYVMKLGEFKEFFDASEVKKLIPKRKLKLFEFIKEVKKSGQWNAKSYNWPSNNCQSFAAECLSILHAVRDYPTKKDWMILPASIISILKSNENI